MEHIMRTFKIRNDNVEEAKRIAREFIHSVQEHETGTLSCEMFQDASRPHFFINLLLFENTEALEQHRQASHTQAFFDNIVSLCEKSPEETTLHEIE